MTRPTSATGPSTVVNCRNEIRDRLPISMFCGLPVIVATLPMFEPVASASSTGSGLRRRGRDDAHQRDRMGDAAGDAARDEAEEARQLQVRDEHHHAEQQDERTVIDG